MPFRPQHSLLRVEVPAFHTIDTASVENLFGMWSLFSKTSHAMEDGKRLENLSWRLWNRETFCCNPASQARSTARLPRGSSSGRPEAASTSIPEGVPALSSSLDSLDSDDELNNDPTSLPQARPELSRFNRCESRSRGCEKHITSCDLEKIVMTIKETQELEPIDLPMPTPSIRAAESPSTHTLQSLPNLDLDSSTSAASELSSSTITPAVSSKIPPQDPVPLESSASTVGTNAESVSSTSESSSNTEMSTHSIVRGFTPGGAPSSYRSQTHLAAAQPTPILKTSASYQQGKPSRKGAMFTIGTSSGEDESSLDSHMYKSSIGERVHRQPSNMASSAGKKQTSFKEEVIVGRAAEHSPVFESDDEDEDVSESAIEDDEDSDEWEDSDDQSYPASLNEKELFQRVGSRPNLTSHRSLLTTLMHEPDRAKALANAASRSTSALRRSRTTSLNEPSLSTSPGATAQMRALGADAAGAQPIATASSNPQRQNLALSPRSTRRGMLATEMTDSLRQGMLWERRYRSAGNLTAMRNRHPQPTHEGQPLRQQPEATPGILNGPRATFTNEYFDAGLQEYHARGW